MGINCRICINNGAIGGYYFKLSQRLIFVVMAFGSGVLTSVLSFKLMEEAYQVDGIMASSIGFLIGALIYTGTNELLAMKGGSITGWYSRISRYRTKFVEWPLSEHYRSNWYFYL